MSSILKHHIESGNFHHGYLLVGDFEVSRKMAMEAATAIFGFSDIARPKGTCDVRLAANPDFWYQKYELFSIDEARDLIRKASQRPFGEKKVFVIELLSFSLESANALLKTMEEPYPGTHFFVLVPSLENIIPTLVSRLTIIDNTKIKKELSEEKIKFYKKFLSDLPSRRLETIKNIKERQEAIEFLCELELVIAGGGNFVFLITGIKGNDTKTKISAALAEIQRCKNFLFSQGASPKMVLEHIALTLPQI